MNISSRENPGIKRLVRLQRERDFREEQGVFVCEGSKLLYQAEHLHIEAVYCLAHLARELPPWLSCPLITVEPHVMDKISDTKNPQGILFTCRMPPIQPPKGKRLLALEDMRDPGNLGTVLRTAEAFGLDGVILLGNCVDVYSPKVIRGAMGALFRLPTHVMDREQLLALCQRESLILTAAALGDDCQVAGETDLDGCLVVVGNEARGISPELLQQCQQKITIPISGIESLNAAVAAAILAWEMRKR